MGSLEDKYNNIKEAFYKNFVYNASYVEQASGIPLSSVKDEVGTVGDGTVNVAYYLQFLYTEMLLGNKKKTDVSNGIRVLSRLSDAAFSLFVNSNKGVFFPFEEGFFLRDDIHSDDAGRFGLKKVNSGYTNAIELKDEDPCYSVFASQDQIWNLAPILSYLADNGFEEARRIGFKMFEYVIKNGHKIYNPYYSALLHHWTFVPDMDTDKVKPWDRVSNRNKSLKYKVKVKRGANNWYFAGGFRHAFNKFDGSVSTFWHCLWYKPFIFLADRLYHPYICKWLGLPIKNNSYYCLGSANPKSWYGGRFHKRLISGFNKSLDKGEPFMPHLVFLQESESVDKDKLRSYLDNWEWDGIDSPIEFLILYNWFKIKFGK